MAWHSWTLSQSCPYLPGCSITEQEQGQGEQQLQPRVPMVVVVVTVCGAWALPALLPHAHSAPF